MNLIFQVVFLSVIAIILDFVQIGVADGHPDSTQIVLRNNECHFKSERCQKQMVTKVTDEEIMALCNAKPLSTTTSKCLIDCQMREYKLLKDHKFRKQYYLQHLRETTRQGYNKTYMQVARKAADLCKDKKASKEESCETAFLISQCLEQEGNKHGMSNLGYSLFVVDINQYADF